MAVGRLAALGAKLEARNAFKQTPLHLAGALAKKKKTRTASLSAGLSMSL
jgi:hypothetical protein